MAFQSGFHPNDCGNTTQINPEHPEAHVFIYLQYLQPKYIPVATRSIHWLTGLPGYLIFHKNEQMARFNQGSFQGPSFHSSSPSDCKNQTHTHKHTRTTCIQPASAKALSMMMLGWGLLSPQHRLLCPRLHISYICHYPPLSLSLALSLSLDLSLCKSQHTETTCVLIIPLLLRFLLAFAEQRQHPFFRWEAKALVGKRYPFLLMVLANDPR